MFYFLFINIQLLDALIRNIRILILKCTYSFTTYILPILNNDKKLTAGTFFSNYRQGSKGIRQWTIN